MVAEFPPCPFCHSPRVRWIIYGFPTSEEDRYLKLGMAILGGHGFSAPRATYYCDDCEKSWLDPDDLVEHIKPTDKRVTCYFCKAVLRPDERLRYEIDAEEYKALIVAKLQSEVPARTFLQPETFADRPQPICDQCRSGIHENERDRQAERAANDRQDRFARILLAVVCTSCVVYVLVQWVLHDLLRR